MLSIVIIAVVLFAIHFFAHRQLEFNYEVTIASGISESWEVLGNQFTEPHLWAANFVTSKPGGQPKLDGLTYLHRATVTASGDNWQELDEFDPQNHRLSYHISKGLPKIAQEAIGHWRLTELTPNTTQLNVDFSLKTKGLIGFLMSPIASKKIDQASSQIVEELKYYIENGKPHPRKLSN